MRTTTELMPLRVSCFGGRNKPVINDYISLDVNPKGELIRYQSCTFTSLKIARQTS